MPVLTGEQLSEVQLWREKIAVVQSATADAMSHVNHILDLHDQPLINGNITVQEDWFGDQGDTWNDKLDLVGDAAQAVPAYESE